VLQAFSGDPIKAQRKGVEFGDMEVWGAKFKEEAEVVIVSPSPSLHKDEYFMSAMKSLEVAQRCLKQGGTIIVVASCNRGWSKKEYIESGWRATKDLLEYDYPGLLRLVSSRAWHEPHRQFQALVYYVQHLAKTCFEKDVVLVGSKGFKKEDAEKLNIKFEESIDDTVRSTMKKYGEKAKVIVIPDSFTLPLKFFHETNF
jgi:nickel-dependent lactate racemase